MVIDANNRNSVINFSKARLVLVNKTSSYVELNVPDVNHKKCVLCSKTTNHDHDIIGKLKFDPRQKSYLLSVLEKKSPSSGLDVIPIQQKENTAAKIEETTPKFKHVYPEPVENEAAGAQFFAKELAKGPVTAAIRIGDKSMHLLNGTPRSLLKKITNCDKCTKLDFSRLTELQQHFEKVHNYEVLIRDITVNNDAAVVNVQDAKEEVVSCHVCQNTFHNEDEKKNHDCLSKSTKIQCPTCLQVFKHMNSFKKHKLEHMKEKVRKHSCNLCNKSFYKKSHLRDHIQMHMGAKSHQCAICDKRFVSAYAMKNHQMNVHGVGEKPKCDICQRSFYNNTLVKKHILEHHQKDERLECKKCKKYYLRKDNLENHMRNAHGTSEKHLCKLCSKYFACKDRLQDHLRTAHGILPWNKVQVLQTSSKPHEEEVEALVQKELEGTVKCRYCEQAFVPTEIETHLRFSHGVMPIRDPMMDAEALLKTLTPNPDFLLRSLTPLPMETLDELILDSAFSKE